MMMNNSKIIDPNYTGEKDKIEVPSKTRTLEMIKKEMINKLKNKE